MKILNIGPLINLSSCVYLLVVKVVDSYDNDFQLSFTSKTHFYSLQMKNIIQSFIYRFHGHLNVH